MVIAKAKLAHQGFGDNHDSRLAIPIAYPSDRPQNRAANFDADDMRGLFASHPLP